VCFIEIIPEIGSKEDVSQENSRLDVHPEIPLFSKLYNTCPEEITGIIIKNISIVFILK
jgi:hypothetical protein